MSSMGYCFNICQTVDQKLTKERRSSVCNSIHTDLTTNMPNNTGALIFGRRFSLGIIAFFSVKSVDEE